MNAKKIAAIAVGASLVLGTMWVLSSAFDFSSLCNGKIYATAPSPDNKFTAYAFERDCGATTDFASFVILKYGNEKLDLTADLNAKEIVFQSDGDYQPTLKWIAKDTLRVSFDGGAPYPSEISFQVVKFWDYKIEYRGLPTV